MALRRTVWAIVALLALISLLAVGRADAATAPTSKPACPDSLQAKIDAARPGAAVKLSDSCVYREAVTVDKPLTLDGAGAAGIRGSDVWEEWTADGPGWVSARSVPAFSVPSAYRCEAGTARCRWPEQVFVDGKSLEQVASNPGAGQFVLDTGRRVVIGENPAGHTVEVTVREGWIFGAADGVTVRGIDMRHAAQDGVFNGGHSDWVVEGNDLAFAHGIDLVLSLGDSLVARDNALHDAGQLGFASNEADVEVSGNHIYGNNNEDFDPGWAAGGMKIAQPRTALISENEVHHNKDMGIWTDIANADQSSVEVSRNRVHHHARQGIRVEITRNFSVHDNVVWENGWGEGDSYVGAGITIAGSRDGTVEDNVLAWNASGIAIVQQDRQGSNERSYDSTRNVRLRGNRIIQDEIPGSRDHAAVVWNESPSAVAGGAPSIFDPAANNGGEAGEYWFDEPQGETYRFKWDERLKTLGGLNRTPAEEDGRYLSDAEKDALLREEGLPGAPEDHAPVASGPVERLGMAIGWLLQRLL